MKKSFSQLFLPVNTVCAELQVECFNSQTSVASTLNYILNNGSMHAHIQASVK